MVFSSGFYMGQSEAGYESACKHAETHFSIQAEVQVWVGQVTIYEIFLESRKARERADKANWMRIVHPVKRYSMAQHTVNKVFE